MIRTRRWLLAGLMLMVACADTTVPEIDCEAAEVKGYSELGEVMSYCTSCHGATRADEGIAFHTYELAKQNGARSEEAIADGSMPEDQDMPQDLQMDFFTWVQCGMPE